MNRLTQEKLIDYKYHLQNDSRDQELHLNIEKKGIWRSLQGESLEFPLLETFEKPMKDLSVEDQNSSGRCWIYASCHMLRQVFIKQHQAVDFLFSQEYIAFYDLLEKANFFLDFILVGIKLPDNDRELREKLSHPVQDAGQWDLFCNIVKKYGMLPQYAMKKNAQSKSTGEMIGVLSNILRSFACQLRSAYAAKKDLGYIERLRDTQMAYVYRFLSICMGTPPDYFDLKICHVDGRYTEEQKITPADFYRKYLPERLIEEAIPISCVGVDMEPDKTYTIKNLGNVTEGRGVKYLNLKLSDMKQAMLAQLKAGYPVWFGCDSRFSVDKEQGILDLNVYKADRLKWELPNKNNRLRYGISCLNHAMIVEGVRISKDKKVLSWLVKNSYGDQKGHQGYLNMQDQWLDQYVYEAVIFRQFLSKEIIEIYERTIPTELPPWHPMGMLAE